MCVYTYVYKSSRATTTSKTVGSPDDILQGLKLMNYTPNGATQELGRNCSAPLFDGCPRYRPLWKPYIVWLHIWDLLWEAALRWELQELQQGGTRDAPTQRKAPSTMPL